MTDSAATFQAQRRRLLGLAYRLLGAAFAGYRSGYQLAPDHAVGRVTFAQFLAERFGPNRHGKAPGVKYGRSVAACAEGVGGNHG